MTNSLFSGADVRDIGNATFTTSVARAIKAKIHAYVSTMRGLGKPPPCVRLSSADYGKLVAATAKLYSVSTKEVAGLRHDGIPIVAHD